MNPEARTPGNLENSEPLSNVSALEDKAEYIENAVIDCENPDGHDTTVWLKYYEEKVEESNMDFGRLDIKTMAEAKRAPVLLPGEHQDIRIDVNFLLDNGDEWLATPNTRFAGCSPRELIDTPDEWLLRDTLRSAVYSGMA